ncbi:hypothetical protein D3C75_1203360 [compost metagenome]
MKQHLTGMDKLVIFNLKGRNGAGNLRRDADLLGAHFAIPGPWGLHIIIPQPPTGDERQRNNQQR